MGQSCCNDGQEMGEDDDDNDEGTEMLVRGGPWVLVLHFSFLPSFFPSFFLSFLLYFFLSVFCPVSFLSSRRFVDVTIC